MKRVPKVLIVDDEPDVLLLLRIELEAEGYETLLAADGAHASDLGAHEYVTKPFEPAALFATVAHVLSSAPADLEAGRRRRLDQLSSSNRS